MAVYFFFIDFSFVFVFFHLTESSYKGLQIETLVPRRTED